MQPFVPSPAGSSSRRACSQSLSWQWTCVGLGHTAGASREYSVAAQPSSPRAGRRVCGVLIGQQDRGFYLAVPVGAGRSATRAGPYRLAFIPAIRVDEAYSQKQLARVITSRADDRRANPLPPVEPSRPLIGVGPHFCSPRDEE